MNFNCLKIHQICTLENKNKQSDLNLLNKINLQGRHIFEYVWLISALQRAYVFIKREIVARVWMCWPRWNPKMWFTLQFSLMYVVYPMYIKDIYVHDGRGRKKFNFLSAKFIIEGILCVLWAFRFYDDNGIMGNIVEGGYITQHPIMRIIFKLPTIRAIELTTCSLSTHLFRYTPDVAINFSR